MSAPVMDKWAVVLGEAPGSGTNANSFLRMWLGRVQDVITPEHVVVVAADTSMLRLAEDEAEKSRGMQVVALPSDKGTAPATLVGLAHVLSHATENPATALVVSSAHLTLPADEFAGALEWAERATRSDAQRVVTLASTRTGSLAPDPSSGMFGSVSGFWRLAAERMPWLAALFMGYSKALGTRREAGLLEAVYQTLTPCDFARSIHLTLSGPPAVPARGRPARQSGRPGFELAHESFLFAPPPRAIH